MGPEGHFLTFLINMQEHTLATGITGISGIIRTQPQGRLFVQVLS